MRLIEHLCPRHISAAVPRWPIAGTFSDLLDQCGGCKQITSRLHPTGRYSIRCLPELDHRTYEHSDAIHEAAHAVVGLAAGMPLEYAVIEPRTDAIQAGVRSHVKWGDFHAEITEWAAMVWAGQRAQVRWFTKRGLNTKANLIDISNQGCHDTTLVLESAAERQLPEDMGWAICERLLSQHWAAIERVADLLLARGHLTGTEIASAAGLDLRAVA